MIKIVKIREVSNGGIAICIPSEIRRELDLIKGQQVLITSDKENKTLEIKLVN